MSIDNRTILHMVAVEFNLERNSTEERLKLQKTIYLLQAYGLKLGYGYSWYKYGPYSQDLVYDAYAVLGSERNKYEQAASTWSFSESCRQKFDRFRDICRDILQSAEQLELVASVNFLCNTWYPSADRSQIPDLLRARKARFFNGQPISDDEMIRRAFDICVRFREH